MIQAVSGDVGFIQTVKYSKFNGFIHSFFDKTINIKCRDTGDLYTLACNRLDNGPNSLVVDINSFSNKSFELNNHVFSTGKILYIENKLVVSLENIKTWECSLPNYPLDDRRLTENLNIMRNHISIYGKSGGMKTNLQTKKTFEMEMSRMLEERSQSLLGSLVNKNMNDALHHAIGIVGLGPGLTPSGDDFLTGLMTVLNIPNIPPNPFKEFCQQVVMRAKTLTNEISYMTLRKASIGKVRESIVHLLHSAINGDQKELLSSLEKVLNIGSSSGTDIALGLVSGLETILKIKK
jgi:hypothetical protein